MSTRTLELILNENPQLLMIGGPPLYLARFRVDDLQIQLGLKNLEKIVEAVPTVIVEHHILRDENWLEKTKRVFDKSRETECKILTAAEYLGVESSFLESRRKRLFAEDPPSKEFMKWMNESLEVKKRVKPPI
jgi:hypothetical protein